MKKIILNLSLLAACTTAFTISGCADSGSGATAEQRASVNNTAAGVGGTGIGNSGVGDSGFGGSRSGAGGIGTGGGVQGGVGR